MIARRVREWGAACVERFNGMWAFAIWDERERACSARATASASSRSTTGSSGRLAFASELKAFVPIRDDAATERADRRATSCATTGSTTPTRRSSRASCKLPPAHTLVARPGGLRTRRYWQLELRASRPADPVEAVRELFVDSVRLRLRSDVTVGTCLSGGLDSSAVACVIDLLLREETRARASRRRAAADVHRVLRRSRVRRAAVRARGRRAHEGRAALDLLHAPKTSSTTSDGSWKRTTSRSARRASAPAGTSCARRRAPASKVVLDGQGGDEVLAGYPGYFGRGTPTCSPRPAARARVGTGGAPAPVREPPRARDAGAAVRPGVARDAAARAAQRLGVARASGSARVCPRRRRSSTARRSRTGCAGLQTRSSPCAACRSCCTPRTATRWRTRSRRACRSSTTASSSCCSHSTAGS